MNDKMTYGRAGIQSIQEMLASPTNQNPPSVQNHIPSQDGDMTQHCRNSPSRHQHRAQQPACSHGACILDDDVSQGHDTDNWHHRVHLDLSMNYTTVFNQEYHTSPITL